MFGYFTFGKKLEICFLKSWLWHLPSLHACNRQINELSKFSCKMKYCNSFEMFLFKLLAWSIKNDLHSKKIM